MTPIHRITHVLSVRRHALARVLMVLVSVLMLASLPQAHADVIAGGGDKSKKESDDKKKEKKFDFLPEARAGSATFLMGQSVEVPLVAAVGSLKQMEFVIRQAPRNGTLSAIRPDLRESNKAVVTYMHRGGDAPLEDSFTYACRLAGESWSAPATVTLSGERLEPKIEVVNLPQFGRVFFGGEGSASLVLKNRGSADFRMEVKWPEPFTGPPVIEVPRGGTAEYRVYVRPPKTGEFRWELALQPGVPEARMICYVVCVQALSVSPSQLSLVIDSNGERSGVLSLANARAHPVRVVMKHPTRLQVPEETEVAATSRSDLRIAIPAGDVDPFSGEIAVIAGEDVQTVSVQAPAKPAVLQVLVPASRTLDFGIVEQHTAPSRELVIANAGGGTLIIQPKLRPPYSLEGGQRSVKLEPQSQARLKVVLSTAGLGLAPGELDLESNSGHVLISLAADIREGQTPTPVPAAAAVKPGHSPRPAAAADVPVPLKLNPEGPAAEMRDPLQSLLLAVAASRGLPIPASQVNPYLASVPSIQFVSASTSEVTIAWPRPNVMPPGWVIETASQVMDPKSGVVVKLWTRYRDWESVQVDGDRVAVRLKNLQPASLYEVRVMAVDREGKVSEPAATKLVQTALPWRVPSWVWSTLIAGLLALIAYRLYRLRCERASLAAA